MLVFFAILAFLAEGFCEDAVIETKIQCGENQVPSDCADNYSDKPQITLCRPGCRCVENYTRNSYDECVPTPPLLFCPKNEEASTCKQTCPPQNCDWDPTKYACKPGPCQPGCNCKKGRLRDESGRCIPQEMCPPILPVDDVLVSSKVLPQCGDNEEPTDCARNIRPFDSTLTIKCRPCQCIEGYVRDINGVCVRREFQCGKNEELNFCIAIFPSNCPPCRCIANYQRNSLGVCVPGCNGDENAFYTECPNQCVSTCKNPDAICSLECGEPFGCQCKYGYILSEEGSCVLPEECPGGNPCGLNKTHVPCNIRCPSNNCPKDDSLAIVQCFLPYPCPGGCACQSNYTYISSEDNICILASDCAPVKCTRNNEEYNPCPSACFSEGCGSPQLEPKICNTLVPNVCRPRCVCQENFRRDSSGNCIPKEKCPPQCGVNEEQTDCGDILLPQPLTTDIAAENIRIRCQPGCACITGYTRDSNGVCVLKPQCGENEELTDCGGIFLPQLLTTDVASENIQIRCQQSCTCIAGYARDSNGVCVLTPQKCTRMNEVLNPCPSACFGDQCGELDEYTAACDTLVPHVCQPRCMCRKDYRRDSNDNCIPKQNCPAIS